MQHFHHESHAIRPSLHATFKLLEICDCMRHSSDLCFPYKSTHGIQHYVCQPLLLQQLLNCVTCCCKYCYHHRSAALHCCFTTPQFDGSFDCTFLHIMDQVTALELLQALAAVQSSCKLLKPAAAAADTETRPRDRSVADEVAATAAAAAAAVLLLSQLSKCHIHGC
jgi:hypothetical protein